MGCDAVFESEQLIFPFRREQIALHVGSGGTEHERRAALFRAHFRDLFGVIAGVGLADITGVVLLVDDDDADVLKGREHRRARTYGDPRLAVPHALPLVVALPRVQSRVHERDLVAETGAEETEDLRCERDLRHEHDRGLSRREHALYDGHVDFRLAASRHAVQEVDALPRHDGVDGALLVLGEGDALVLAFELLERGADVMDGALLRKSLFSETVHRARAEHLREDGKIFSSPRFQVFQRFALSGRAFQCDGDRLVVKTFCRREIYALELRVSLFPQFCGDEESEHVDVTEIVAPPHLVHERELLSTHGSVEISRRFQILKVRLLLLADDEADGVAVREFHRDAAAERDVLPLVIEGTVYLGGGDVDDDFKHHSR